MADGNELTACAVRMGLALLALLQGRLDDAMDIGTKSLRTAESLNWRMIAVTSRNVLAWNAAYRGDDNTAAENAVAAEAMAKASGSPLLTGLVGVTRGARSYSNGELEQARTALAEGLSVTAVHRAPVQHERGSQLPRPEILACKVLHQLPYAALFLRQRPRAYDRGQRIEVRVVRPMRRAPQTGSKPPLPSSDPQPRLLSLIGGRDLFDEDRLEDPDLRDR